MNMQEDGSILHAAVRCSAKTPNAGRSRDAMRRILSACVHAALLVVGLLYCFPFLWMVISSFKFNRDVLAVPLSLFPPQWNWHSYSRAFLHPGYDIPRYFLNSVAATVSATGLSAVLCVTAGYGFSKYAFRGNKAMFLITISTMMIPFQAVVVPLFLLVTRLGFANTLLALILPVAPSAFGVFLMRQFFYSVPQDMIDSGRIEGAGELKIFLQIAVPLAKSAVTCLIIFHAQWVWNMLLWPLVVITNPRLRTVPQAISLFTTYFGTSYPEQLAVCVAACIPMLVLFLILSRHFVRGVALTGMKV